MECLVDLRDGVHGNYIELKVVSNDSTLGCVHTRTGDGIYTRLTFVNGTLPPFPEGSVISIWNYEKDTSVPDNKGLVIDLTGPCRWVWRSTSKSHSSVEPVFCELFSGLGGWTRGLKTFNVDSTVLVEKDITVARASAKSLQLPMCHVDHVYNELCKGVWPSPSVLVGDLADKRVWTILSYFQIDVGCMSPPCQPWSRASRESGLAVCDGKVFAITLMMAPHVGIRVLNVENVSSIELHPHYQPLIDFAKSKGYKILHSGSYEAFPFIPIKRDRWLASFVDVTVTVKEYAREWADKVRFPIMSMGVANLSVRDCLQQHFDEGDWIDLQPCADAILKMNQKELLPSKFPMKEGQTVFQARLCSEFDPIGGAMAMYGRQHSLPIDLLRAKGLFTTLLKLSEGKEPPRYYSAWEFLSAMAWPDNTMLPTSKFDAWHAAGNAISIPHTVLCIFKMHGGLQSKSPFGDVFISLRSQCEKVFARSIKLSRMIPYTEDDIKMLAYIDDDQKSPDNNNVHDLKHDKPFPVTPSSIVVQPRSNPFARVHGLPQGEPNRASFPFRSIDHDNVLNNETPRLVCIHDGYATPNGSVQDFDDFTMVDTSMCPTGLGNGSGTLDGYGLMPTQVDVEDDLPDDDDTIARGLLGAFDEVANEAKNDRILKKRRYDEDDTWYFNIDGGHDFPHGINPAIDETMDKIDWQLLRKSMIQASNNTGICRMWPLDRQVMIYCPITKWSCVTIMSHGLTVLEMIRTFLPNARPSHFHAVKVNEQTVTPQSIPPGTDSVVIACIPVESLCYVTMPNETVVQCKVDVTSTGEDIRFQVQNQTDIKATSIEIFHKGVLVNFWDRACMCDSPDFVAKYHLHVRMPGDIVVVTSKSQITFPPAHSDVTIAVKNETLRFSVRHPIWTTVRTVSASVHENVASVLDRIFPDLKKQFQINMLDGVGNVLNELAVSMINIGAYYEVEFGSTKPYPVTQIEIDQPIGIEEHMNFGKLTDLNKDTAVKRWVRSPFQTKPYEQHVEECTTLVRAAGQYFAHGNATQTVMTLIDGKIVDPRIKFGDVPVDKIITFRSCPLVGGGKEKDKDVKKIMQDQLSARGVPSELVQSRVEGFLAKVMPDKIRTHAGETWARQWVSLKQLANEARFRLITTDELRTFQNRKKVDKHHDETASASTGASTVGSSITSRGSGDSHAKKLNLSEICIDLAYFKAGDDEVKLITIEAFGPDSCGVTIMHSDSAVKYLPIKRLSADSLAIIAVGGKPITDAPIKMAPAKNSRGEPILIPMCILNFGDTPVNFVEGSMKADLATQDAMVVEFTIYRNEVDSWDEVKSPMVYLGLKIAETKTVKILSTWAVKSYSEQRKPIEHSKATYVHGYLRVLAATADPLLARSGWFGIYLVPKNSQKKPHEAYSIVPVPNKSAEQLQAIVQSTKNALGIIKTSTALAIRCRREHTFAIKKIIYPDLPLREEGVFSQGDRLFVLKHLEAHTNIAELTEALQKLGWTGAKALRALGANAWSIASPNEPPSSHVCLNGKFVVIAPQMKQSAMNKGMTYVPPTAAFTGGGVQSATGVPGATGPSRIDEIKMDLQTSTSTKIEEIKTDLKTHVQEMVEASMKSAAGDINQLKQAMGETHAAITQIKSAQDATEAKIKGVESTIKTNGDFFLSQMTSMFNELKGSLNQRLDKIENITESESKRPRI